MTDRPPALEIRSLSKAFGAIRALQGVSLAVAPGEIVGLVGDNGAGKSTLINVVSGALQPDAGEILVDGVVRTFDSPSDARRVGIETVYQFLCLIPTLDIAENVYLGRELLRSDPVGRRLQWMDKIRMRRRVEEGFARLGLSLPSVRTKVGVLSGGQRQAVAIARAVLWGSHIVMLDEPTAALGVRQTEIVLSFVERLKAHGVAVVLISHNVPHVLRVADRVVVLRLGQKAFDGAKAEITGTQLVGLMTGAVTGSELDARPAG